MNKNYERYLKLIKHYRRNPPNELFCEKHHIIPLCKGGEDSISNIVVIPARAHIICHHLLHKAFPDDEKLAFAFSMMCVNNKVQRRKFSSRLYEKSKLARAYGMKGKPRPDWVKEKLRKPKRSNRNYFGNTNGKGNTALRGKAKSTSHKAAIKNSLAHHFEKMRKIREKKKHDLQTLFLSENLSRKDFCKKFSLNYSTTKPYLAGL